MEPSELAPRSDGMKHLVSAIGSVILLAACSGGGTQPVDPDPTDRASAANTGAAIDDTPTITADATQGDPANGSDMTTGATKLEIIPAAYRGTWARNAADCAARNFNRVTIAADRVNFFEDGGIASDISQKGNALAVTYPFENPNGVTESRVAYLAQESADQIRVKQGREGTSQTYQRC